LGQLTGGNTTGKNGSSKKKQKKKKSPKGSCIERTKRRVKREKIRRAMLRKWKRGGGGIQDSPYRTGQKVGFNQGKTVDSRIGGGGPGRFTGGKRGGWLEKTGLARHKHPLRPVRGGTNEGWLHVKKECGKERKGNRGEMMVIGESP